MKTRQLIKGLGGALVAAALVFSLPASADTQLIHFDDASNGWKWYSDVDNNYLFDPTNLQSSALCASTTESSGNGSCVIEGKQGVLPRMTRPEVGPTSQGGGAKDPTGASGELQFTLDSFYFLLTGKGTGAENAITVEGSNGATFTFQMGATYAGPLASAPVVTFYEGGGAAGVLTNQVGYIATFGDLFAGVTWIQFSAPTTAQVRLDCIVATSAATTTEKAADFTQGCDGKVNVPEPGTLALLGIGLFGMGLMRRRHKV